MILTKMTHRDLCLEIDDRYHNDNVDRVKGSEAFTDTTSSHKKHPASDDLEITQQQTVPSSSSPRNPSNQSSIISSTPRFIPPHLVVEGSRQGRSPTPEVSTGASSPSAAYAGLTLDPEGGGDVSGAESRNFVRRRGSLANKEKQTGRTLSDRSSSPVTKRPAADMEEGNLDGTTDRRESVKESMPRRKSQTQSNRHKREASVDMLNNESESWPDQAPLSTVPESGTASLLDGAYQTPATSTSGSGLSEQGPSGLCPDSNMTSPPTLSIDEQISKVTQLVMAPSVEGQIGYIVSNKWLARVLSRSSDTEEAKKYPKEAAEGPVGPVDNTGINMVVDPTLGGLQDEKGNPYIPMRADLTMDEFTIFPEEAWDLIIKWYGLAPGSAVVTRYCHNTSDNVDSENLQFELHPPIFTILKLPNRSEGLDISLPSDMNSRPVKTLASRHEIFKTFLTRAKQLANIDVKVKVRIWKIFGGLGNAALEGMVTPDPSRANSPAPGLLPVADPGQHLVLDIDTFARLELGEQRELVDVKDETANEKYNGRSTIDLVGLRRDEVIVLEEQVQGPGGGEWVSDTVATMTNGNPGNVKKTGGSAVRGNLLSGNTIASGRSSPAPSTGIMTRGRAQKNGRIRGTVGLGNLGNTCYMNSALQCLRSVEELAPYFISGKYKKELNMKNPLGFRGVVAKAYAGLLGEIYSESNKSSFSPRDFKNTVGRCMSMFSSYNQQDSQEFLGWLLSGLEEDLNRIKDKPYIEKPDSTAEMVNDPKALQELADKCWNIYKARNDSVISELFAGVYKSTVACPSCPKVSIIFDPFTTFTLQLPVESLWYHNVYYFPLYGPPVLVAVDVDKNASMIAVKERLAKKFERDPKKMMAVEIYKNKFFKVFDGSTSIAEERLTENDTIAVYEIEDTPTNWPPPTKTTQKKALSFHKYGQDEENAFDNDPSMSKKMLVAVHHRYPKPSASRFESKGIFGVPSFILVNPEEADDYDAILRKVLVNVQAMTTRDVLRAAKAIDAEDSDTVLMTADEIDDPDSKVQTQSVDSEDGMVDVSMRDADEDTPATTTKKKGKGPPSFLKPGKPIDPTLRNLFDIKVFPAGAGATVPSGFNVLSEENKPFPNILDRRPKQNLSTRDQVTRRLARLNSASSSDEDVPVPDVPPLSNGSGSDSENELPPVERLTQPDQYRQSKRSHIDETNEPKTAGDGLVRLGEAILLDWNSEAYDALFGGLYNNDEDPRGVESFRDLRVQHDPEFQERKRVRERRRKHGISLEDCLDEFVKPETLSENDAWYCPDCKAHRRATKTFELWKCPDILVIHLKRFSSGQARLRDKLDIFVDFPVEGLDLTSRIASQEEDKSAVYDLFAVDNHYGGLGGGHYTAFAKNYYDDRWYEYNDTIVHRTESQRVVTSAAYLLFYRRRSDKPLGGPFFERLLSSDGDNSAESQGGSRATSPAGEGRRLDDSSRNGSSSAFPAAGAIHQAGGGGSTGGVQRTGVDDDLPAYGPPGPDEYVSTLESLETEEDEGIGMEEHNEPFSAFYYHEPTWQFPEAPKVFVPSTPRYKTDDIGRGDKSIDTWRDMPASWRRSNSSTAVVPSSPSDDEGQIHFVEASDDPGTTNGFAGLAGERAQDTTPVDEIESDTLLEDDLRKRDDDGDSKMD
ncbi:MAG: hypothetical protein Q9195_002162 [Heterodermia aff. obscurata]